MSRRSSAGNSKGDSGEEIAQTLCRKILDGEGVVAADVGMAYADDKTLRTLNSRHRNIDRTTDVLSFTYEDGPDARGNRKLSGDVIVSVPRVKAQAKRYKVSEGMELARLLTHGFLHLCGHDHKKPAERKRMRALETAHLDKLTKTHERALTRLIKNWVAETE